ncbi:MAG: hemolysin III family protein, partial [Escherichia coli]|nr:hemolysin III family protein [Escherichia coli]
MVQKPLIKQGYSLAEEIANSVSHGIGLVFGIVGLVLLLVQAVDLNASATAITSYSLYGGSMILLFLASTLYHSMNPQSKHKDVFHILDHIFIYVAIAGSYTPVALMVIGGWQGVFITILQWAMVLFGIFYKSLSRKSIPAV